MGFKTGVLVGFGVGYVFGTRAGRERYEELKQNWDRFMGNPQVQRMTERGKDVVETGARKGLSAVQGGVEKAADKVKDKLDGSGTTGGSTSGGGTTGGTTRSSTTGSST